MKGGLGIGVAIATAGVVSCSLFVDTGGLGGGGSTEPAPVDAGTDAGAACVGAGWS